MVVRTAPESLTPCVGLLAAGITDTILAEPGNLELFDLDSYLPMLYNLIPAVPDGPDGLV
jgi:hypothetical protein